MNIISHREKEELEKVISKGSVYHDPEINNLDRIVLKNLLNNGYLEIREEEIQWTGKPYMSDIELAELVADGGISSDDNSIGFRFRAKDVYLRKNYNGKWSYVIYGEDHDDHEPNKSFSSRVEGMISLVYVLKDMK